MPPEKNTTPQKPAATPPVAGPAIPGVAKTAEATDFLNLGLSDQQLARIERAIIVAGAINGLVASGRVSGSLSQENRRVLQTAVREALDELNRGV
jgi:hypothetical protein